MYRPFIQRHPVLVSILVFLLIFIPIQVFKPAFLYNTDGSIRNFGVAYRNKTILPVWLFSIVLGILCYLAVLYYTSNVRVY